MTGACEQCAYFEWDEEREEYLCGADMDEDEYARLQQTGHSACPYFRNGDEYSVVRHQI